MIDIVVFVVLVALSLSLVFASTLPRKVPHHYLFKITLIPPENTQNTHTMYNICSNTVTNDRCMSPRSHIINSVEHAHRVGLSEGDSCAFWSLQHALHHHGRFRWTLQILERHVMTFDSRVILSPAKPSHAAVLLTKTAAFDGDLKVEQKETWRRRFLGCELC